MLNCVASVLFPFPTASYPQRSLSLKAMYKLDNVLDAQMSRLRSERVREQSTKLALQRTRLTAKICAYHHLCCYPVYMISRRVGGQ